MDARGNFPPGMGDAFFPCDISELQALVRSRNCLPVLVSLPFLDKSHFYQVTSHKRFRSKKRNREVEDRDEAIAKEMERIVPESVPPSSLSLSFSLSVGISISTRLGDSWNLFASKERLRGRDTRSNGRKTRCLHGQFTDFCVCIKATCGQVTFSDCRPDRHPILLYSVIFAGASRLVLKLYKWQLGNFNFFPFFVR